MGGLKGVTPAGAPLGNRVTAQRDVSTRTGDARDDVASDVSGPSSTTQGLATMSSRRRRNVRAAEGFLGPPYPSMVLGVKTVL